ncbi:MAG: S1 family peptidase [Proteobacteria bacterium]|nr:S1 family peptidase [Pseudomonadota bacterium]
MSSANIHLFAKMSFNLTTLFNISLFIVAICSANMSCESNFTGDELLDVEGDDHIKNKGIIGGEETEWEEEWRGVVSLGGIPGMSMCTGTLIDPLVVLTAGHCVKMDLFDASTMPELISISGGAKGGRGLARGQRIIPHPTWTGDINQGGVDLALIKLNHEVTTVPHYKLRDFPMPKIGDEIFLVGYGDDGEGNAGIQRKGDSTILDVQPGLIQIGGKGKATTCPGDSGGPVFIQQEGEWRVIGVNSFGAGAVCDPVAGMWSVNTLNSCSWLNSTMEKLVGHGLGLESCGLCDLLPACVWGHGCGPGLPDCPRDTTCIKPEEYSDGEYGYCAAPCCEFGKDDLDHCTDISSGEEKCDATNKDGEPFCMIYCEDDSDCPDLTVCKNRPFESEKICIATADVSGDIELDTDTCPVVITDAGTDTDSSGDSDVDTDTDTDTDVDSDTDTDADSDGDGDCGCQLTGNRSETQTASFLISILIAIIT